MKRGRVLELDQRGRARISADLRPVAGGLPGELIEFDDDGLRQVLEPSQDRTAPNCALYQACPGCQLRHTSPQFVQRWKAHGVLSDFGHQGLPTPAWENLGSVAPDGYRKRSVIRALSDGDGRLRLGMVGQGRLISLSDCPVQTGRIRHVLARLEDELRRLNVRAYDQRDRSGELRHLVIEEGITADEVAPPTARVRLVLCFGRPFDYTPLLENLLLDEPQLDLYADTLPFRNPPVLSKPVLIRGESAFFIRAGEHRLRATLPAWTPQSHGLADKIQGLLVEWLQHRETDRLLEVGCGIVTNSVVLAPLVSELIGIDACREAIEDARYNADRLDIRNASFQMGYAQKSLIRFVGQAPGVDLVVIHAMRRPYGPRVMGVVQSLRPRQVIYLSPSARSLAEDLSVLTRYQVDRLGGVDQSPGTTAMLTVASLSLDSFAP